MEHKLEFRISENPWAPTAVVEEINARTDAGLVLTGLAEQAGGTSSAAFVRWPDGRDAALIRTRTSPVRLRQTAKVMASAGARGLPVPAYQLILPLADGRTALVQERLPGRHIERLDPSDATELIRTNDRFAGIAADHPDLPAPPAFPIDGERYGSWEHTIGARGERGQRLLERLLAVDGGTPFRMLGDDLVHLDYSPGNVLFDETGRVSGVVDWNDGAVRGDRRYALVAMALVRGTRLIGMPWTSGDRARTHPEALARLEAELGHLPAPVLRSYEAHWVVAHVDASIVKGFAPDRIDDDLARAETFLAGLPT